MKKIFRWLLIIAAVLAVLLAAAAVLIKAKYPPERVKALVLSEMEEKLHRKAQVGDVSISLFKGVELSDFKLSERPDFTQGSFVECRSFRLGFSLWTILRGKLVLSQVELDSPRIHVVRLADGKTFNFSDITGSSSGVPTAAEASRSPAPRASGAAAGLLVESLEIKNGVVDFVDETPHGYQVDLKNLDFSVDGFSLLRPFKTAFGVNIGLKQGRKSLSARVELSGKVSLKDKGRLELSELSFVSGRTTADVQGTIDQLLGEPLADLRIQLKSFDPATAAFFAELPAVARKIGLSADLSLKGTQSDVMGSGTVKLDAAGLKGALHISEMAYKQGTEPYIRFTSSLEDVEPSSALPVKDVKVSGSLSGQIHLEGTLSHLTAVLHADASGLNIQYADLLKKAAGVPCRLQVKTEIERQDTATVHELSVVFGPLALSGSGVVSGLAENAPRFNLNIDLSPLSLNELAPMVGSVAAYKPQGSVSARLNLHGTQDNPLAEGTVQFKGVALEMMPGIPVSALDAVMTLKADSLSMPSMTGRLMESPFQVNLAVQNFAAPRVNLEGSLEKLDVGRTLAALSKSPSAKAPVPAPPQAIQATRAAGPLIPFSLKSNFTVGQVTHPNYDGKGLKLQCDLSGKGSNPAFLKGTASFQMGKGVVHNIPLVSGLAQLIAPSLSQLAYDSLDAKMDFNDGQMHLTESQLKGQIGLSTTGTYTFANEGLDFTSQVQVPRDLANPALSQYFSDTSGMLTLNLTIGGTLSHPVYPSVGDIAGQLAKKAAKNAVEQAKEKAGEAIQEGLKNLLKF